MTLTLTVLRCPDAVAPETRVASGGEFSIGRGPDNSWVLADPDRHLSKRHCILAFRAGFWQLADTSTNGTFLNRDADPVGQGAVRDLRDGDRLRLGQYEIEVRIAEEASFAPMPQASGRKLLDDPFGDDPFGPAQGAPANPFAEDPLISRQGGTAPGGIGLPPDYDPLAPDLDDTPFGVPSLADHSASVDDAFRPPQASSDGLPDDWDLDLSPALPPQTPLPPALPRAEAALPVTPQAPEPMPQPRRPPPEPATPVAPPLDPGDLMGAFLRGAGIDAAPADPLAAMEHLGAAFRALVAGLRQALIARAAIKGEFRIEQTMIRARGNNPLKFSAGDDDALAALLGSGRRIDMTPQAAVADALRDMRLHELATTAAMQSAVRALLARFDPEPLRVAAEQGAGALALPAQKRARAWDAFEKLHGQISRALADDFDSVFGKAFARAYEQALREAADKETQR